MKRLADSYLLEVKDHKRAHCFFLITPYSNKGLCGKKASVNHGW